MILDIFPDGQSVNYKLASNSIIPRPIAWVSTVSKEGVSNLAPFSFFAPLCTAPLIFGISIVSKTSGLLKDTLVNAKDTGRLTISTVQRGFLDSMQQSSEELQHNTSEFETFGIESFVVDSHYPPMVKGSLVAFLCDFREIISFGAGSSTLIIEAKKSYVDDSIYNEKLKFSLDNVGRASRSFV